MKVIKKLSHFSTLFLPARIKHSLTLTSLLNSKYGQWQSSKKGESIDSLGKPIPWYTYPALEYLMQFDFSQHKVFEWGSGNSSLYWSQVAKSVTSIEDNPEWFNKTNTNILDNLSLLLIEDKQKYVNSIQETKKKYDLIIIDGSHRYECAVIAANHLNSPGLIILDNSDWCPHAAKVLRDRNLLQVDFSGFGPIASCTWTTSLFFDRSLELSNTNGYQPTPSLGAIFAPQNPTYGLK